MKNLFIALTLTLTASVTLPSNAHDSDVMFNNCVAEGKGDIKMIKYCLKENTKALTKLTGIINSGLSSNRTDVFLECDGEWQNDPKMALFCTLDGFKTLDKLNIK